MTLSRQPRGRETGPRERREATLGGRYRVVERLNRQEASSVYRAHDLLTGRDVVAKLLPSRDFAPRLRAEVSALRLLHLPGVARLLDEGSFRGRPFLVTELVEGSPFPGPGREGAVAWSALEPTVVSLLEILARVHERGVVHRDLKPDNVLVDGEGRPVVLDFGLSYGVAFGAGVDRDPRAVGTPAYAAPEQIRGERVDARADLYSLGIMLFEALAGVDPQAATTPDEFLQARLHEPMPSLGDVAPQVPARVVGLVDDLLAREPERRPRSAGRALRRLRGDAPSSAEPDLPWLGRAELLTRALGELDHRRDVRLRGERGSGRSSLLAKLGERLVERGDDCVSLVPVPGPLQGLGPLAGNVAGGLDDALARANARVRSALASGVHVLVDDADALDRWSREVLESVRSESVARAGRLVLVSAGPAGDGDLEVPPLREDELRALFAGPDRLFHFREDGARELVRRTGGWPRRVREEVAAWLRAGLVHRTEEGLAIDRSTLARLRTGFRVSVAERSVASGERAVDPHLEEHLAWVVLAGAQADVEVQAAARGLPVWRVEAERVELLDSGVLRRSVDGAVEATVASRALEAWTEEQRRAAHARLADHLPAGSDGRLLHLVSSGRLAEVPDEACAVACRLRDEGRLAEAEAALVEGLVAVRALEDGGSELRLLGDWFTVAIAEFTPQALDRVLYELARAEPARAADAAGLERLDAFGRASLAIIEGSDARSLAAIEGIAPFEHEELERWRLALSVQSARAASAAREKLVLERIARDYREHPSRALRASVEEWLGRLRYRQNDHLEAVRHYERAVSLCRRPTQRLSAMLNGASALLEACAFDRARELAEEARAAAAEIRHTLFEVRAEWVLRSAAYRSGDPGEVDLELARAARRLGVANQEALVCLNEAAVAWRADDLHAPLLANRAAQLWGTHGNAGGTLIARALEFAARPAERPSEAELAEWVEHAASHGDPTIAGQSLALLARAGAVVGARAARVCEALRRDTSRATRAARREVLSIDEVLDELGRAGC